MRRKLEVNHSLIIHGWKLLLFSIFVSSATKALVLGGRPWSTRLPAQRMRPSASRRAPPLAARRSRRPAHQGGWCSYPRPCASRGTYTRPPHDEITAQSCLNRRIWRFRPLRTCFLGCAVTRTLVRTYANMYNLVAETAKSAGLDRTAHDHARPRDRVTRQ